MNLEFRAVKEGRTVAGWVKSLKGKSGVYIIRERGFMGGILYVGGSHSGRLGTTLLRHFQHWTGPTAGPTFPVSKVEVGEGFVRMPRATFEKIARHVLWALLEDELCLDAIAG